MSRSASLSAFLILMLSLPFIVPAQAVSVSSHEGTSPLAQDSVSSSISMRECIVAMPDSVMPLLTKVNREDCVDFVEAGMAARVTNRLQGITTLQTLTDNYARWQYTAQSIVEMKLLPMNDSIRVLCVVHTVQLPQPDSSVSFYDTSWQPLPAARFLPTSFAARESSADSDSAPLLTTNVFTLSPDADILTISIRNERMEMDNADPKLSTTLTSQVYTWQNARFLLPAKE